MLELMLAEVQSTWGLGLGAGLAGLGAGLVALAAAIGLSNIAGKALESIARQPEAADKMFTPMLLTAAMFEGVALFAAAACFLGINGWTSTYAEVAKTAVSVAK